MPLRRRIPFTCLALVWGCSEPGAAPAASASEPLQTVAQVLTISLDRLPNYAAPAWPVHYDAALRARDNTPAANPVTDRGATLGRVLFHDKRLSVNNTVSCASCHQRAAAFGDAERFSVAFNGTGRTAAHSMRLANARFYAPGSAFWDRRAISLEAQATQPIRNPAEMGFDDAHGGIDALVSRLRALPYYTQLFSLAFGDATITEERLQRALAQYVRSIVSVDSRFDEGFAMVFDPQRPDRGLNATFANLTAQENRGKQLFLDAPPRGGAGCGVCHVAPTFALAGNARSNGLDAGETRVFKSPSLKSAGVTGPYMHDGRLATLEQVVEHYASGVQNGPALDNRLRGPGGQPQRLQLSAADKAALVAFLRTLTDNTLATDPRFADPFKR